MFSRNVIAIAGSAALAALGGCSRNTHGDTDATSPAAITGKLDDDQKCIEEPREGENDERQHCDRLRTAPAPHAYRFVGGGGDPIDQVVCDIGNAFVLDGRMFGVELSGGLSGSYKFVRTPKIPGLNWSNVRGSYLISFPEGEDKPGIMTTNGGGTTNAGAVSRTTIGAERFTLTPVEACKS